MRIRKDLNLNFKNCLFIIHDDIDGAGCEILAKVYMPNKLCNLNFKTIDAKNGDVEVQKAINSGLYDAIIMGDCSFRFNESLTLILRYIGAGNQFFLVDHHKNAMEFESFDWAFISVAELKNGDLVKNSGTELMYQFLNQQIEPNQSETIKTFVELVRNYDTWDWFKDKWQEPVNLVALFEFDHEMFVVDMVNNIKDRKSVV